MPGSLESFFAERYQFYAAGRAGLLRARVHHDTYGHLGVDEVLPNQR
jgi:hypothetical protein